MTDKFGSPRYLKYMNFNQDYSCASVGFDRCYKVYNCEPFGECFSKDDDGGACIVDMLFATSLVAVVGLGDRPTTSPRKLKIINTKRKSVICELSFPSPICLVRLNRKRLVVLLHDQVYIYDVSCMKLLHTTDVAPQKTAIGDLSASDDSVLVFPAPPIDDKDDEERTHGAVVLFDALNMEPIQVVQAHKSPIQRLALSKDGTLLATASSKGTIVRVFRVSDGKRLYEFRRGTYSAVITDLSFNLEKTMLSCCSLTGTVHFFRLDVQPVVSSMPAAVSDEEEEPVPDEEEALQTPEQPAKRGYFYYDSLKDLSKKTGLGDNLWTSIKSVRGKVNDYLPATVSSMLEPKRDFAFIRLPHALGDTEQEHTTHSVRSIAAVNSASSTVSVLTSDGNFYVYSLPPAGGACVLVKQYKLED